MTDTNIKVENTGTNLYLVTNMNCNELRFENNIVYYSGVPEATSNVENFKVFQGPSYSVNKLTLTPIPLLILNQGIQMGKLPLLFILRKLVISQSIRTFIILLIVNIRHSYKSGICGRI